MKFPAHPATKTVPKVGEYRYDRHGTVHLILDVGNFLPGQGTHIFWGSGFSGYVRTAVLSETHTDLRLLPMREALTHDEATEYRRSLAEWHNDNAQHYRQVAAAEQRLANELEKPLP